MKKPVYKLLDEKGRVLIPLEMRQKAEMEKGDILKVSINSGKIVISKVDILEVGKQDAEAVEAYVHAAVKTMSHESRWHLREDFETCTAGGRSGLLKSKYKAFEIQDDKVSETVMDGNLIAIADFIKNCKEGSIITIHTLDGKPFLIGMSKLFLYCEDNEFLNNQLIPYLRGM